jgi:hypothetical protein
MNPDLPGRLRSSPDVYLQKIDLVRDAGLLIQFERGAYRAASFLDDRILGPQTQGGWSSLARIIGLARDVERTRPLHFIFHAGHVGSTLLSRLLDETGAVLSLREPLPLRTLAEAYDAIGLVDALLSAEGVLALQRALVRLWGRAYDGDAAVVLKATSSTSRIAPRLLAEELASRAVFLNVRPQVYLATLLAGQNSALDLRGHGSVRIRALQARLQSQLRPLHALSLGELAAMSWLAEAFNEAELLKAAAGRVLSLDFDDFLRSVETGIGRVLNHLGLLSDSQLCDSLARSPVLTRYSKAAEFEYSPELRAQVLNESMRTHGAEIRRGLGWLEAVARADDRVAALLAQNAPATP